jgi:B12-binding domain/radical SAM domain protein
MSGVIAFRRSRLNHNSLASVIGALTRSGLPKGFRVALCNHTRRLPQDTRVVAFSFSTPELDDVLFEVRDLKERGIQALLVAGGPHPSADPQGVLQAGFDAVFVGEGEESFPGFVREVAEGEITGAPIRRADSTVDLDKTLHVAPAHGLFPFAEISRGCNHACAFCQVSSLFTSRMRHRSPETVARGVARAVEAGFKRIRYLTPDAFAYAGGRYRRGAQAISALLESVDRAGATQQMLGNFPSEVRPDRVDEDLLQLVRERCFNRTLVLGAQSGSDRVLGLMRRGHTVEQARTAVMKTAQADLTPHVDIMFCFPGEKTEERRATLDLAEWCLEKTNARLHAHVYLPLPGTSAWPAPPEAMEPSIMRMLKKMESSGRLDGDWERQTISGKQILRWREGGKILV